MKNQEQKGDSEPNLWTFHGNETHKVCMECARSSEQFVQFRISYILGTISTEGEKILMQLHGGGNGRRLFMQFLSYIKEKDPKDKIAQLMIQDDNQIGNKKSKKNSNRFRIPPSTTTG